jgi:alkylation response protein AidB-like acyl-CoA dehydrogenase
VSRLCPFLVLSATLADPFRAAIRKIASLADTFPSSVEPFLEQYDQWGQRVDRLHTSEGWRTLKGVAAEEGLVSIAQERKEGEFSRLRSFAKAFLFMPDSLIVGCPISMTDGAARVIEVVGTEEMKREILPRLCSRDPAKAWTSGQWMTERPGASSSLLLSSPVLTRLLPVGGSDVSLTETVATPVDSNAPPLPGSAFLLNGFKWFSSATDGDIALALARTGGPGSKGLSLFLVKLKDEKGKTNGVFVHRLKKKWGTKVRCREATSFRSIPDSLADRRG